MPRFHLHVYNGTGLSPDDEGTDFPDEAAARVLALNSIRSIVAEEAVEGLIDLTGRIEIRDPQDDLLDTVWFVDAFDVRTSDRTAD